MHMHQVNIATIGPKRISAIRAVRLIRRLGIRDASAIVAYIQSTGQCTLIAGVERSVAEHAVAILQDAGATATVEESSVVSPMLLQPAVSKTYWWHWFFGPSAVRTAA